MLVFGDSLSAGYGIDVDQSWTSLLQTRLQEQGYEHRVVNASISGETTEGGATRAQVAVSDDGIGIPRSEQRRIFDDFFRASNAPKGQEGTGLGLALVRRHCESQSGEVRVESELGAGATFTMAFPAANSARG